MRPIALVPMKIFVGLPGGLMWGLGLLYVILHFGFVLGGTGNFFYLDASAKVAAAGVVSLVGFAMATSYEILSPRKRYRMDARHLPPCMVFELVAQVLGGSACCLFFAAVIRASSSDDKAAWIFGILSLLVTLATVLLLIRYESYRMRRKSEYEALHEITGGLPPIPATGIAPLRP